MTADQLTCVLLRPVAPIVMSSYGMSEPEAEKALQKFFSESPQ